MKTHLITFAFAGICTFFLSSNYPVKEPINTAQHQEMVAKTVYKIYAGQYQMSPTKILTITHEKDRLFGEPTGEQKVELHPESEHVFTIKEFKAKITFIVDAKGEVTQAVINLQNKDIVAKRVKTE